ncbi:MAG: S8 family serine peptidase [Candidatus Glassbacteria bacterium]|nr:S8 family serine peptidase [Candidatus Glassbacteria bacterium]
MLLGCLVPGLARAQSAGTGWEPKADRTLRDAWHKEQAAGAGLSAAARKTARRKVFLHLSGDSGAGLPPGVRLLSRRGGLATAEIRLDLLPAVAASPAVIFIRAGRMLQPCDDFGVLSVRARRVPLKLGITGRGVLIGVLDSGIDWRHPDFRNSDGSTRIEAILDLSFSAAELAEVSEEFRGPYQGVLITRSRIDQALAEGTDLPHRDYMSHGTHCAGTAAATAGISRFGAYGGVAPEADIIAVKVSPTQRDSVFSDISILHGLEFIDSLAAILGLPYVVNMSFGGSLGPHDGSTGWDRYIAEFARPGPAGRALVVAAGNERNRQAHARGDFGAGTGDSVVLELRVNGVGSHNDELRVEVWLSENHPGAALTLVSPGGERFGPFEDGYGGRPALATDEGVLVVENAFGGPDPDAGDRLIAVEFYDSQAWWPDSVEKNIRIGIGPWKMVLAASTGSFDAYLYGTRGLLARFGSHATELGSVTEPGAGPEMITVGAYVSRTDWSSAEEGVTSARDHLGGSTPGALAYFSGLGPNRKEVLKPEVVAPGRWVMAAMSGFAWPLDEHLSLYESPIGGKPLLMVAPDSIHGVSQGTSFATPHVAGICALLLQADPGLSNARVKEILTATATGDSLVSSLPDNYWGYGRANAIGAVRSALGITADSVVLACSLGSRDTLPADSLVFSVAADFTASAQVLRSIAFQVLWPAEYLCLQGLPGTLAAGGELVLSIDTTGLKDGKLGVRGCSGAGLAARDTLLRLVLKPRLALPADSVSVALDLEGLSGDLEPEGLEGSALVYQAGSTGLAPAPCLGRGDVDGSGRVDIFDLLALLRLLAVPGTLPPACADLNADCRLDIFDLLELLQVLSRD